MAKLIGPEILDLRYYFWTEAKIAGAPVVITRTGWTSEVGYEVYLTDSTQGVEVYDAIMEAGEELSNAVQEAYQPGWDLATAVRQAVRALSTAEGREIEAEQVEAAVLDRTRPQRRKFRRLREDEVATTLAG
jgi:hypothetical protein